MTDNKRTIVYISGWKGAGRDSGTFRWLEKHFTNLDVYATGGCTDPAKMQREISAILARCEERPLIVGNSYGAFLASLLDEEAVIINPALYPSQTLPDIADLTAAEIDTLARCEAARDAAMGASVRTDLYPVTSTTDELIPDHRTGRLTSVAPVEVPGGRHRLTDAQREQYVLPVILKALDE